MYFTNNDDANVSTKISIKSIEEYQHRIYRISTSNSPKDLLYANSTDEMNAIKIMEFLYSFNYDEFKKLTEMEKEEIFNKFMKLYGELIWYSDNLRIKYIKEYFRE